MLLLFQDLDNQIHVHLLAYKDKQHLATFLCIILGMNRTN